MQLTLSRIEAWACELPVDPPIPLGRFALRKRSHLAVRVSTREGLVADCVTQTRGSPLDVVISDVLAPRIIGRDALDIAARRAELERELVTMELYGAIGRAWSALEICLHDLQAQAHRWPLWRLLGAKRAQPLPVVLVEGYALAGESDEAFADRLAARVQEGFSLLKIEGGHYSNSAELLHRLELFRRRAGDSCRLVLDFAWAWGDVEAYLPLVSELQAFGIEWIEDPFPRDQVRQYSRLRGASRIPAGCGDETSRSGDLMALLEAQALDVVRVDATTVGGIGTLSELTGAALAKGSRVSYHEHPEIHEHCAFGLGAADHIEMFPTDRPFDRVHDLIQASSFQRVTDGKLAPSDVPGTGIRLRDEAVAKFARRQSAVTL